MITSDSPIIQAACKIYIDKKQILIAPTTCGNIVLIVKRGMAVSLGREVYFFLGRRRLKIANRGGILMAIYMVSTATPDFGAWRSDNSGEISPWILIENGSRFKSEKHMGVVSKIYIGIAKAIDFIL